MDAFLPEEVTNPETPTSPEKPIEDSTVEAPDDKSDEKAGTTLNIPTWAYGIAAGGTALLAGIGVSIYRVVSKNRQIMAARGDTEIYKQRAIEGMTPRTDNPPTKQEPVTGDFSALLDTSGKTE